MPLRGVNLGNWLVLERWMKPALFAGTDATDEYSLGLALGDRTERVLREHRETFITESDFRWMRDAGLNAVRIPIGYWLLNPEPPFVGGAEYLDRALDWCDAYGITANLDFHGLPGHQGPEHHSGRSNHFRWDKEPRFLAQSLDFVEQVAQTYKHRRCVNMISLVNEPDMHMSGEFLMNFYEQGYDRVRKHMSADDVIVTIAAFTERRLPEFHRKLVSRANVMTDVHPYPCFSPHWKPGQLVDFIAWGAAEKLPAFRKTGPEDLIVGEWSLSLAEAIKPEFLALPPAEQEQAMRTFAGNELLAFEQCAGWYFWSYKTEIPKNLFQQHRWSYRDAVENGWLPRFAPNQPTAT